MHTVLFALLCIGLGSASHIRGNSQQHFYGHRHTAGLRYSQELLRELRDFTDLIPTVIVDELVAKHMLIDGDFRKAFNYLRSSDFKRLQQHAEQLSEMIQLINFVHLNDSDNAIGEANSVHSRSKRCAHHHHQQQQLVLQQQQQQQFYDVDVSNPYDNNIESIVLLLPRADETYHRPAHLHTFISFVQELLSHLPHDRFVAMINAKRQHSVIFAKFYEALRSAEFKPLMEKTLKSANMASILDTLNRNGINVESLKTIGYEVISWGPAL